MRGRLTIRLPATALALSLAGASCALACDTAAFSAAETAGGSGILVEEFRKLERSGACKGDTLDLLGRRASIALYRKAFAQGADPATRRTLLEDAAKLGRPWQVLAALADEMRAAKQHGTAASAYQEALDDIRNVRLNPTPPPNAVIASLVKKAEAASLLAAEHIARVDRNGNSGGLACQTFRDLIVVSTSVPVEFEYREPGDKKSGADAFTRKGRTAADDLADHLVRSRVLAVHLIGHTDARGSADYNLALSQRRAEALKAYLASRGFSGEVRTSGNGLSQPFQPEDAASYSQDERWQMDRRVELEQRGGVACGGG